MTVAREIADARAQITIADHGIQESRQLAQSTIPPAARMEDEVKELRLAVDRMNYALMLICQHLSDGELKVTPVGQVER